MGGWKLYTAEIRTQLAAGASRLERMMTLTSFSSVRLAKTMLTAALVFCARAARADDVVLLKDGGRVKGTVMVEDKTSGVSVKLADGTTRQVAASDVDRVEYAADHRAEEQPDSTVTRSSRETSDEATKSWPVVKLESPDLGATLDMIESEGHAQGLYVSVRASEWSTVCSVPCNKRLDPNRKYRIGSIARSSGTFTLPANSDEVRVSVEPGSNAKVVAGATMRFIGMLGTVVGGVLTLADLAVNSEENPYLPYSLATVGVGIPLMIGGTALARSGETEVRVERRAEAVRDAVVVGASLRGQF